MKRTSLAAVILCLLAPSCALGPSAAATGPDGSRLALLKPANQWMKQGASDRIALIVERTGFRDAVDVKFVNFPKGVRVEGTGIPEGDSTRDFVLVAAADAEIVASRAITIEVSSHGLTTSQSFLLSVKAR